MGERSGLPTDAAASAGIYTDNAKRKHPSLQLLTIEGLMSGVQRPHHPDYTPEATFKKARREKTDKTKKQFGEAAND